MGQPEVRDELKTAEFQRLYGNTNGVRSSNGLSLDQLQVSDDEEDVEDDIEIVAFNIHGKVDFRTRWFQEQDAESNVKRPTSPPIYDSDYPLYECNGF
ncbi:hypothetical protein BT96DRAFT_995080 [Gymnopus androsaceus JB14]|uniref:Uncharacterized protein n=1 Tax=Gymnopus androsaceus JB14 TaxID=1447944 RepID=A0A6A4HJM3_9AGAR|nr:hypothetical protein BT96DRAFT_995080 [Gymnopus androsaceus JB14]